MLSTGGGEGGHRDNMLFFLFFEVLFKGRWAPTRRGKPDKMFFSFVAVFWAVIC